MKIVIIDVTKKIHSPIFRGEFTEEQIRAMTDYVLRLKENNAALNDTVDRVCAHYMIEKEFLFSKNRKHPFALARHLCVYRLVNHHNYHKSTAARIFFKNHSSAYNSLMRVDKKLMNEYEAIFGELAKKETTFI